MEWNGIPFSVNLSQMMSCWLNTEPTTLAWSKGVTHVCERLRYVGAANANPAPFLVPLSFSLPI